MVSYPTTLISLSDTVESDNYINRKSGLCAEYTSGYQIRRLRVYLPICDSGM